jgi:hypothetical protein
MLKTYGHEHHQSANPYENAPVWAVELGALIVTLTMENMMATKAQLDKLQTDIAALIQAGVDEITAAVAAAQTASPDPAIDTLDTAVTTATDNLKAAAAALTIPPATPAP